MTPPRNFLLIESPERFRHTAGFLFVFMLFTPCAAFAQPQSAPLHFLEEYAVKLYNKGETNLAIKEFQRIQRIDPQNKIAQKYLNEHPQKDAVTTTPLERLDRMSTDITALREEIANYEKDVVDLEYFIRALVTENDGLYLALSKRSREVMELREKLYGTKYGDQYKELMEAMIDRVPQRPHTNYSLPSSAQQASISDQSELTDNETEALVKELAFLQEKLASIQKDPNADQSDLERLEKAVAEKTGALAAKKGLLEEKKASLTGAQEQLLTINQRLKTTNDRYIEAISAIDRYYQSIKEELSNKNFREQKMFSELLNDYSVKLSELEEVKLAQSRRPASTGDLAKISSLEEQIMVRDREIGSLKQKIADQRQNVRAAASPSPEHSKLAGELEELRKEIAERDQELSSIKKTLNSKQARLATTDVNNTDHEKESAELRKLLERYKRQISEKDSLIEDQSRRLTAADGSLKQTLNLLNETSPASDAAKFTKELEALREEIAERDRELASIKRALETRNAQLKTIDNNIANNDKELLEELQQLVERYKKQLAEKDNLIETQSRRLASADRRLDVIRAKVSNVERLLLENHDALSHAEGLARNAVAAVRNSTQLTARESDAKQLFVLEQKLRDSESEFNNKERTLRTQVQALEGSLKSKEDLISALKQRSPDAPALKATPQNTQLQHEVERIARELARKQAEIEDLELKLSAKDFAPAAPVFQDDEMLALEEALVAKDTEILKLSAALERKEAELAVLKSHMEKEYAMEMSSDLNEQEEVLKEALLERDQEVASLNRKILAQEEKISKLMADISATVPSEASQSEKRELVKNLESARAALKDMELNYKERDLALDYVKNELGKKEQALIETQKQLTASEEKLLALEYKEGAMRSIVVKRDDESLSLRQEVKKSRQELGRLRRERARLSQQLSDKDRAVERALRGRDQQIVELRKQLEQLRQDIILAHGLLQKQSDSEGLVEELEDRLEKKERQVREMQDTLQDLRQELTQKTVEYKKELAKRYQNSQDKSAQESPLRVTDESVTDSSTELKKQIIQRSYPVLN